MQFLFHKKQIICTDISSFFDPGKNIQVFVARLDQLHPIVSGNKIFKLAYYLQVCKQLPEKALLTFGGAYSNHLVATAFACKACGIAATGIVRGEEPEQWSPTLLACKEYGMNLIFVSREAYKKMAASENNKVLLEQYNDPIIVPEGGYGKQGALGASHIMDLLSQQNATHICTAVGTATTLAGLSLAADKSQEIIGIPVLKNISDIPQRLSYLTGKPVLPNIQVFPNYHEGGYAKHTKNEIDFMNRFFEKTQIPTDFVYTGKLMLAISDLVNKNYFNTGSKIICLHTGGLQGNTGLPPGTLIF